MTDPAGAAEEPLSEKEMEERFQAFQLSQQVYVEQTFKWLIDFVGSYFPEDQLIFRDLDLEVHFVHKVMEGEKTLGALVYRFRKFQDKAEYFEDMGLDYKDGLELPEVFFVDSETSRFEESKTTPENYTEIPSDKITGRIKDLREDLKRRAKLKQLKDSL